MHTEFGLKELIPCPSGIENDPVGALWVPADAHVDESIPEWTGVEGTPAQPLCRNQRQKAAGRGAVSKYQANWISWHLPCSPRKKPI